MEVMERLSVTILQHKGKKKPRDILVFIRKANEWDTIQATEKVFLGNNYDHFNWKGEIHTARPR